MKKYSFAFWSVTINRFKQTLTNLAAIETRVVLVLTFSENSIILMANFKAKNE